MTFPGYRISSDSGRVQGAVVDVTLDELSPGDVVIRAAYSSVNYKDALAATGAGKVLRRTPLIGGIDVAGVVETSADPRFRPGDAVLVTGFDLGVANDGGYAAYVRVPAAWVVAIPAGLSPRDAMILGTAGFTAALSIVRLEANGLAPGQGPVIVTGATGGVGALAVAMLHTLGYTVTAVTGKDDRHDWLRDLGASEVLSRRTLEMGTKPLETGRWAGAVDPVGGATLAWLTRTMLPWGSIANSGLTGGIEVHTTVMPFILRGVSILGIDSVTCPMPVRDTIWRRLGGDMKPAALDRLAHPITLAGLPDAFATLLAGDAVGRFLVEL